MNELPNPTFPLSPNALPRGLLHRPESPVAQAPHGGIVVAWAKHLDEVREAQRLRHQVFAIEMGARLATTLPGHDVDLFDDYCEHLLVRDVITQEVIGTYRVLTPTQAKRAGSTYSDIEFDLVRLRAVRERMVEVGRSCVHPAHRQGTVIMALMGGVIAFTHRLTTSVCPLADALCRAVQWSLLIKLTSAPASINKLATKVWPWVAACINGVQPSLLRAFASACCSSNSFTTLWFP